MLDFTYIKNLILEKALPNKATGKPTLKGKLSDTQGKLFELHTARSLRGGSFPEHFRAPEGSPTEVANAGKGDLIKGLGKKTGSAAHDEIVKHGKIAADHVRKSLTAAGHKIKNVFWTSQKSDVGNLTNNPKSDNHSDFMVRTHKGKHIGVSLKMSESAQPNLGQNTHRQFAKKYFGEHGDALADKMEKPYVEHRELTKKLGFGTDKTHAQYRELQLSGHKTAKTIDESSRKLRTGMAKNIHGAFKKMSQDDLHGFLSKRIGMGTDTQVMYHHYNTKTGKHTHIDDPVKHIAKLLEPHKGNITVKHNGTTGFSFHGNGGENLASFDVTHKGRPDYSTPEITVKSPLYNKTLHEETIGTLDRQEYDTEVRDVPRPSKIGRYLELARRRQEEVRKKVIDAP